LAKLKAAGESDADGVPPVPFSRIGDTVPLLLPLRVSEPLRAPVAVGVKTTLIAHAAPEAKVVPQLFVWLKSPVTPMLFTVSAAVPVLLKVRACVALEVFTS